MGAEQFTLRAAAVADAAAIAAVHVASWRTAYRGIVPDRVLDALDVARRAAGWRRGLQEAADGDLVAVALRRERLCGFVRSGATAEPHVGEVHALYVDPGCWGKGVGGSLLERAEQDFLARGCTSASLWVFSANQRARGWYERRTWAFDGTERVIDFDGAAVPALRYVKQLNSPS